MKPGYSRTFASSAFAELATCVQKLPALWQELHHILEGNHLISEAGNNKNNTGENVIFMLLVIQFPCSERAQEGTLTLTMIQTQARAIHYLQTGQIRQDQIETTAVPSYRQTIPYHCSYS